jgi:hypothetical protein
MPFINVVVSLYVPASNALALFKQASGGYFLPQASLLPFHTTTTTCISTQWLAA